MFGAKASDNDWGENSRIVYEISGKDASSFVIDRDSGVIRARRELTRGESAYHVKIQASDCAAAAAEPKRATAHLAVRLWQRQLFPTFHAANNKFTLPENVPEGRLITKLSASSPKGGEQSHLTFGIAGGNIGDALRIEPHSGEVSVASGFDYETSPFYEAWVQVQDSDTPSLRSVVQLLVNVTDANDNAPQLDSAIYNATVLEEEYPPQFVIDIHARDIDSGLNGQVTYHLVNDFDEAFVIDESTGRITTGVKLDREELASYELKVEARDRGEPQLSGVATVLVNVLDKNDNPPRFTRLFSVNVTENAEIGASVIHITSLDQDVGQNANVTYSFAENPDNKFAIDATSGNVTVAGHLDREEQDEYLLKVVASDGAWGPSTALTITIQDQNDNAPEFLEESYKFYVPEMRQDNQHHHRQALVGQVSAVDRDKQGPNSLISYGLQQPSDLFGVDPATGEIYAKRALRYKRVSHRALSPENLYSLTIVASDNGKPPLSSRVVAHISVVDANNHAPKFDRHEYMSPVPLTLQINERIVKLTARDESDFGVNAEVDYAVVAGNGSDYFSVDKKSGWVAVARSLSLIDALTVFTLVVRAEDKGVPPQSDRTTLTLIATGDNNFAPVFAATSYQVRVPENEPVNTTILTVRAIDGDHGPNGMVRYEIAGSHHSGEFSVNAVTGAVTILKPLDYDQVQEYNLNVTATDLAFAAKRAYATLTVNVSDINDNAPCFDSRHYLTHLEENTPPNSYVYRVTARDVDSPKYAVIRYKLLGGTGKDYFKIDERSGVIASKASFDYEEANEYTLDIVAENPDSSPQMLGFTTVTVKITGVNEYYPKFVQSVFHLEVSESAEVGTSVGIVQATDQDSGEDGRVFYILVGSSNDRGFAIGPDTGVVTVSRRLDRETQNRATLTVMAKNYGGIRGNDTDEAQIMISIQDGNDPPEFLQTRYEAVVAEDAPQGTPVLTVRALDKDIKPQNNQFAYSIVSGDSSQSFKIDSQSGVIETARPLDRESVASYEIIVGAIDTGSPPQTGTAVVRVQIADVNDNGPVFRPDEIVGYIGENEPPGTSILTLSATDPDSPVNGAPFTYKLLHGPYNNLVKLDGKLGLLTATRSLDRETLPRFQLSIQVEDSGTPRMHSEHQLSIIVTDRNDNPSNPRPLRIHVFNYEEQRFKGKIADVRPNDADIVGDYSCKLLSSSNSKVFSIPNQCDLHANRAVSSGTSYSLSVSGNDGRHAEVVSKITVEFLSFSNATLDNGVTLQVAKMSAKKFLEQHYRSLQDTFQGLVEHGQKFVIYGINENNDNLEVQVALETPQGDYY